MVCIAATADRAGQRRGRATVRLRTYGAYRPAGRDLVPDAARAGHPGHRAGYIASPRHRPMGVGLPLAGRRRDASAPGRNLLVRDRHDEGILVAAAIRDVTDRLRLKDLERASQGLESFIYSVSHDLRAPLRALSGYSEVLLEDFGRFSVREGRGHAERIVAVSEQMGQQIDYLLQYFARLAGRVAPATGRSRRGGGPDRRGDPAQGTGRRVSFAIEQPVKALADRRLIRTVLENLIDNAWKFTSGRDDASIEFGRLRAETPPCAVMCATTAPASIPPMRQAVPAFPAAARGPRLPRHRHRPGQRAADRGTPRRPCLGEGAVGAGATFYFTWTGRNAHDRPDYLAGRGQSRRRGADAPAFKKSNISDEIVVMRDGAAAWSTSSATATATATRRRAVSGSDPPRLELPKVGGLEVLHTMRADERTQMIPVSS